MTVSCKLVYDSVLTNIGRGFLYIGQGFGLVLVYLTRILNEVMTFRSWLVYLTWYWYIGRGLWYIRRRSGISSIDSGIVEVVPVYLTFFFYFICPDTDTSISVVVSVRDTGLSDLVFIISDEVLVYWTLFAVYLT